MDGRRASALFALVLAAVAGCEQKRLLPIWPDRVPDPHADRKPVNPPAVTDTRPTKLIPETLMATGNFYECQARTQDNLTDQGREYFQEQARKAYQRALELDAKHVPAHLALARLYEAHGNHDRAMESYQNALKIDAKDPSLRYEVGMVLARHKQWEQSLQLMKEATELDPDNRVYTRSYGLALARAGKVAESLVQLRKVLSDAEAHFMVARMMHHLKQEDACRQHLDQALKLNPNLQPAKELLAELGSDRAETTASYEEPVAEPATEEVEAAPPAAEEPAEPEGGEAEEE
jgi:tetratricopeptide (TPR) repeat protein